MTMRDILYLRQEPDDDFLIGLALAPGEYEAVLPPDRRREFKDSGQQRDAIPALNRVIARMANGQDTSPWARLQLAAALRDGQVQLVPRRTKGRRHNLIADFMIAFSVHKELHEAYGKRGQLAEAYRAVAKQFGKSPKRIEQIWLKTPAAKLSDKDPMGNQQCACELLGMPVVQCACELNRKSNND
jgi:hypothetical protein